MSTAVSSSLSSEEAEEEEEEVASLSLFAFRSARRVQFPFELLMKDTAASGRREEKRSEQAGRGRATSISSPSHPPIVFVT